MATTAELLVDGYSRIQGTVHRVLDGIDQTTLDARIDPDANSISWLVWHLSRVQDDHVADVAGTEQVWLTNGWADRFGLPFEKQAIGYGQSSAEVAAVVGVAADDLRGYYDDVHAATVAYLRTLTDEDLDRIVDTRWDPPVTLCVRLVSVLSDDLQHTGQAAYVRGVVERMP